MKRTARVSHDEGAVAVEYALLIMLIAALLFGVVGSIGSSTTNNIAGALEIFRR